MAKSMHLLWGSGSAPCWRLMITLEEKKLQGYQQKLLSFEKMEHKSKEVLEINPRGQLPTFKHGENIINESVGACLYLENQFKSQGNKLIPDSPAEQALMYQRMMEGLSFLEKMESFAFYDFFIPEGERLDSALKRNKDNLVTELKLWESYLENVAADRYLAGGFSLADVVVFPNVAFAFAYGLSPERYPKLAKYYNLLKDRPSIKATWPPKWFLIELKSECLKDI
ncbi:PREDICTED: glutathione S-transferase A-like [Poecilia mexicana]|uniref:Glutathione S-transferase rho n=1 Tax=Poecilia mexicana TaxID=48701 RepID=A0A3B3XXW4_9TELE|nr:PREDICTED: glutathione S-transferase A-like isoform X2 [Poecilia formosa]XP_014851520.1 PREDICTED: glutathione S-transferase A-like [Poecilia mexicana]